MEIKISPGNSKLGANIPNISLIPVADCSNCEQCKTDCYALKSWRMYPQVRKTWRANSNAFREDPVRAIRLVYKWFQKRSHNLPRFFRIHVAGDFISQQHVNTWNMLADTLPDVKFLAFTKAHCLDFRQAPANLQVVLSMWPGMSRPTSHDNENMPRAWVSEDGKGRVETRTPEDAIECPGSCESCSMCWSLEDLGRDVVFHLH